MNIGPRVASVAVLIGCVLVGADVLAGEQPQRAGIYAKDNLVAWCVVPFDAKKRGPEDRAEMLKRLGIKKLAYDWRGEHVPTFEREILALKKQGIEFSAFWGRHEGMFALMLKHGIKPEIWQTAPSPRGGTQAERVAVAGRQLMPLVERTKKLGCRLGLYNHGGWGGEPENLAAVCKWLRDNAKGDHVGIVYNFHHGHEHIKGFAAHFGRMKPYLLCVNLNGMNDGAKPKILPIGSGKHEAEMMRIVLDSGYTGPIGILDHRGDTDAEQSLRENLDGLKELLKKMGETGALESYR